MIKPSKAQIKKADTEFQKAVVLRDGGECLLKDLNFDCDVSPVNGHHVIKRRHLKARHKLINGFSLCVTCHPKADKHPKIYDQILIDIQIKKGVIESQEYWDKFKMEAIA